MPRSRSEAMLNLALAKQEDAQKLDNALFKSSRQSEERNRRSGWGRSLLGLVGAALGTAIAPGIGTAIGASLGGRLGSEVGEGLSSSPSKLKLNDYLFGKQDIRNINRNIAQQNRDFNRAQNVAMATDAISGYLAGGKLQEGMNLLGMETGMATGGEFFGGKDLLKGIGELFGSKSAVAGMNTLPEIGNVAGGRQSLSPSLLKSAGGF